MKYFVLRLLCVVVLCLFWQGATAQSVWGSIKEKASEAWNSDARRNAWEKTKEKVSSITESDMLKSVEYTVPITGREFYNFVPDKYMLPLSEQQYQSYLKSNRISQDKTQTVQVNRVANRLIEATKKLLRDNGKKQELESFKWEVKLVNNPEANAFCMPGGKIVVYDGILSMANDDASLACVLGHEIAHAIAKHSAEQMTKGLMSTAGVLVLYSLITSDDMSSGRKRLYAILASSGLTLANLKFSRLNETEADRLGLIIAAMAGYDPEAAVGFWQKMGEKSQSRSSRDWYSTHPSNANRISNIKSFLPEARRYMKSR